MSLGQLKRIYTAFNPPAVEKSKDALKFGIIGAANSAAWALLIPAKLHPEVVVHAIAARDRKRAEEFAKKNNVPVVYDSYQDLLDDPEIDCILVPLPNALHFEWAVRSIRAGKHVLLEKPSVSNYIEAQTLFNLPELDAPNAPVLLEAFHYRFHPIWSLFMSLVTPADVVHVNTFSMIPWWFVNKDHIHFNYNLAGGTMMGMGTYNFAALRLIFGAEPEECISADVKAFTEGVHHDCDYEFKAKFRFPNGCIGEAFSTLQGPTIWYPSYATVTHRQVEVPDKTLPPSQKKFVTREVTINGFIHAIFWSRIDVKEAFEIRDKETGRVVKKWTEKRTQKAYSPKEAGGGLANLEGEEYWMSFRYQLGAFVDKIKGRKPAYWVNREDSALQMKMVDMAYEKSGLGIRPTSKFQVN
ncbi:putative oxidoreductase [Lentithecium fluviatile CBS 122367]|uniref:D-xylose 1-dehydrogenase (NADP(+), D-xylono-1,5-lactone-forming) n=1 Tax=Lentithecium fluviatile CBS 122367 TaxID=1168545 RepID=A0A6G1IL78_9PLEO|nr:putative oxidoreductase [Lentithecium fluviatile CBS 122367]